jgi:anti-sigma factor RsiW
VTCDEVVRSLSDYIDGALDPTAHSVVEEHIASCQDCHIVLDSTECTILLYRVARTAALAEDRRQLLLRKLEAACRGCHPAGPPDRG